MPEVLSRFVKILLIILVSLIGLVPNKSAYALDGCTITSQNPPVNSVFNASNLNPDYYYRIRIAPGASQTGTLYTQVIHGVTNYAFTIPDNRPNGIYFLDIGGFNNQQNASQATQDFYNSSGLTAICGYDDGNGFELKKANNEPPSSTGGGECIAATGSNNIKTSSGLDWAYINDTVGLEGRVANCDNKSVRPFYDTIDNKATGNFTGTTGNIDVSGGLVAFDASFKTANTWLLNLYRGNTKIFPTDLSLTVINDIPRIKLDKTTIKPDESITFTVTDCPPTSQIILNSKPINQTLQSTSGGKYIRDGRFQTSGVIPAEIHNNLSTIGIEARCDGRASDIAMVTVDGGESEKIEVAKPVIADNNWSLTVSGLKELHQSGALSSGLNASYYACYFFQFISIDSELGTDVRLEQDDLGVSGYDQGCASRLGFTLDVDSQYDPGKENSYFARSSDWNPSSNIDMPPIPVGDYEVRLYRVNYTSEDDSFVSSEKFRVCTQEDYDANPQACEYTEPGSGDGKIYCPVCPVLENDPDSVYHYSKVLNLCCKYYGCNVPASLRAQLNSPDRQDIINQAPLDQEVEQYIKTPENVECTSGQSCWPGRGCVEGSIDPHKPRCVDPNNEGVCNEIALGEGDTDGPGTITLPTDPAGAIQGILGILLSISGMIALGIILRSGYQIMTSQGNPEALQEAKERLTSAIVGLLFIIFALLVFEIIGADILKLPGITR